MKRGDFVKMRRGRRLEGYLDGGEEVGEVEEVLYSSFFGMF